MPMTSSAFLELPSGYYSPAVYCPVCGTLASSPEDDAEPCVHLVYIYSADVNMFCWSKPGLADKLEAVLDAELDSDDDRSAGALCHRINKGLGRPSVFTVGILSGLAPHWDQTHYAFDFAFDFPPEAE